MIWAYVRIYVTAELAVYFAKNGREQRSPSKSRNKVLITDDALGATSEYLQAGAPSSLRSAVGALERQSET